MSECKFKIGDIVQIAHKDSHFTDGFNELYVLKNFEKKEFSGIGRIVDIFEGAAALDFEVAVAFDVIDSDYNFVKKYCHFGRGKSSNSRCVVRYGFFESLEKLEELSDSKQCEDLYNSLFE